MALENIIFGKDKRDNIVNISYRDGAICVYRQDRESGAISKDTEFWTPYALTNKRHASSERLKGDQYYKYKSPVLNAPYEQLYGRGIYKPRSIEEGYMLWTGTGYYKNLKHTEIEILSFDIETTTFNPNHKDAKVLLISNTFRNFKGEIQRGLFDLREFKGNEKDMIEAWCAWVRKKDPSIILGHNVISFDLFYLFNRAQNNNIDLQLGRDDDSVVTINNRVSKFRKDMTQQYEFNDIKIQGRDIVDTFFLAMKYDAASRNLTSYGLKNIEKQLGFAPENRIEWDFAKHPPLEVYTEGGALWEEFKEYCRLDSDSPIKIYDLMIPAYFYLNRSIPKTMQQMINEATGSYIDSFMVRSYLQEGFSQPVTDTKASFEGAVSMGLPGLYENVLKVDVASLYPSIMIQYGIYSPEKDPNCNMLSALTYFRDERLKNKQLGAEGSKYHQDLSESMKIFINSMYGFLGANYLLYNCPEGAAAVTRYGREIVKKGVKWATGYDLVHTVKHIKNAGKENEEKQYHWVLGENRAADSKGFNLVNVDTDSFSIYSPDNTFEMTKESFRKFIGELNSIYPDIIKWEDDGAYSKVLVIAAKNYVLQKHPIWCKPKDIDEKTGLPKLKYKGSSIVDQKKEKALLSMMKEIIDALLEKKDEAALKTIYVKYIKQAMNILDINNWSTKKTVTAAILEKTTPAGEKAFNACKEAVDRGIIKNIQEGDKFWVYQAMAGLVQKKVKGVPQFYKKTGEPVMVKNTILRYPQLWKNDHDSLHYVARVYDTALIFSNLVSPDIFTDYTLTRNQKLLETL